MTVPYKFLPESVKFSLFKWISRKTCKISKIMKCWDLVKPLYTSQIWHSAKLYSTLKNISNLRLSRPSFNNLWPNPIQINKYSSGTETFSEPEIKFYHSQFIKYDKDKDGMLNRWELNELYREKYGRTMNSSDLEKMLLIMGLRYCDNNVTFTQYMTLLQRRFGQKYCLQELIQIFDMWDKDSNGLLDFTEFRKAVGYLGFDPDHPDLQCKFEMSDRDYDDNIDFDEFVEAVEVLPCLSKRCLN